ncbi:hypothetical protein [Spiroplasma endosymbiont of Danaus chrysippus]|nr:hypothetical protein [Spiroplasma endosymbiont of Danaus chrysippus]
MLRISFTKRLGWLSAFLKCPIVGLFDKVTRRSNVASCKLLYLSFTFVLTWLTTFGCTSIIVTGTSCPLFKKTCDIPSFLPKIPFIISSLEYVVNN